MRPCPDPWYRGKARVDTPLKHTKHSASVYDALIIADMFLTLRTVHKAVYQSTLCQKLCVRPGNRQNLSPPFP